MTDPAIYSFNPSDLSSIRINPLDSVQTFSDCNRVSHLIMRNTKLPESFSTDQIWEQSETHLLNSLILFVVGLREGKAAVEGDNANLAYIRTLLRDGPDEIARRIKTSRIELAVKEFNSFLKNTSPNFRFGVTSGLLVRLNPWVNKSVAMLTEVTDFDINSLKQQLFTFYFAISTKTPEFKPVAALAFNYLFDLCQQAGYAYPLTLFLDELTNYGYIPELPDKLTHIRHQKIGAVLGIQHPIQLTRTYGDKNAILLNTQPGTRIYFRPRDSHSAESISRCLGNQTIQIRKVTSSGAIHEDERSRPLLDASEIMRLPKSKTVALTPSTNPLILDMFHPTEHDQFTKEAPPARPVRVIDDRLVKLCEDAVSEPEWKPKAARQVASYSSKGTSNSKTSKVKEQPVDMSPPATEDATSAKNATPSSNWGEEETSTSQSWDYTHADGSGWAEDMR